MAPLAEPEEVGKTVIAGSTAHLALDDVMGFAGGFNFIASVGIYIRV